MPGIAKNSIVYSGKHYGLLGLGLLRNVLLADILGQSDYNYWVLFQVFIVYVDLSHLGLRLAASREIPILNGQNLRAKAEEFSRVVFGGTFLLSVIVAGLFVLAGFVFSTGAIHLANYDSSIIATGLFLSAVMVVSEQTARYFLILLRTSHQFVKSSIIELTYEIVRTAVICGLAFYYSATGGIAGYVISITLLALYFLVTSKEKRPSFNIPKIRSALTIGIPLFFTSLSNILIISIDRIVATIALAPSDLSVYGFAIPMALLPVSALQSLRDVLFPSFGELSSTLQSSERFGELYSKALRISAIFAPILTIGMLLLIEPVVHIFVPKFSQAIDIMFAVAGATILFGIGAIPNSILLILRMHWCAFRIALTSAIVFVATSFTLVNFGLSGIHALIAAIWISYIIYTAFSIHKTRTVSSGASALSVAQLVLVPLKSVAPVILGIFVIVGIRGAVAVEWITMYLIQCAIISAALAATLYINRDLRPELARIVQTLVPTRQ